MPETVSYRATSAWTDPIVIVNVIAMALFNDDIRAIIPVGWAPYIQALIAFVTIVLQIIPYDRTDRPVRMTIAPGQSKPIALKKLA